MWVFCPNTVHTPSKEWQKYETVKVPVFTYTHLAGQTDFFFAQRLRVGCLCRGVDLIHTPLVALDLSDKVVDTKHMATGALAVAVCCPSRHKGRVCMANTPQLSSAHEGGVFEGAVC